MQNSTATNKEKHSRKNIEDKSALEDSFGVWGRGKFQLTASHSQRNKRKTDFYR